MAQHLEVVGNKSQTKGVSGLVPRHGGSHTHSKKEQGDGQVTS